MSEYSRAYIEISRANLLHNIEEICKRKASKTEFIAVLKANAYGHDSISVAKILNEVGIKFFAVASLEEALRLRQNNIKGEILILGYTSPHDIDIVIQNGLTQSIVDLDYAYSLIPQLKDKKLKVHIQVDTGLHRLGLNYDDIPSLIKVYAIKEFIFKGIYSHFSMADSANDEAVKFTLIQNRRFNEVLNSLKSKHINYGKAHIQGSYGFVNYPNLVYDYIRIGMLMYGNKITLQSDIFKPLDLKPVLSLKSHIIHINEVKKGEHISYGSGYKSDKNMKIATVAIGYKDGYPRSLNQKALVYINKKYAKVIGICMDQLIIDVTDIDCKVDDVVELIGEYHYINATYVSSLCDSVACELLSRLSPNIKRLIV